MSAVADGAGEAGGTLDLGLRGDAHSVFPGQDIGGVGGAGGVWGGAGRHAEVTGAGAEGVTAGGARLGAEATVGAAESSGVDGAGTGEAAWFAVEAEDGAGGAANVALVGGVEESVTKDGRLDDGEYAEVDRAVKRGGR